MFPSYPPDNQRHLGRTPPMFSFCYWLLATSYMANWQHKAVSDSSDEYCVGGSLQHWLEPKWVLSGTRLQSHRRKPQFLANTACMLPLWSNSVVCNLGYVRTPCFNENKTRWSPESWTSSDSHTQRRFVPKLGSWCARNKLNHPINRSEPH